MSTASDFKPRLFTASEYVLNLFDPADNVAVVVRNRATGRTIQRVARADTVAGTTAIAHATSSISVHTVWSVLVVGSTARRIAPRRSSFRARKISFAFSKSSP